MTAIAQAQAAPQAGPPPEELDEDTREVLILAVLGGRLDLDLVLELCGPNLRGRVGGSPEGTLLHHAARVGKPELVSGLLALGADPAEPAEADYETPLGWAVLASEYHDLEGRDYVAAAELLAAAGNPVEPRFADVAHGALADWLRERLPRCVRP